MSDSVSGGIGDSVGGAAQRLPAACRTRRSRRDMWRATRNDGVGEVRAVIRAQPITAALVVFALGYLFGRLGALIPTGGTTRRI